MRVLTQEEQMAASASAEKFARDILKEAKQEDFGYQRLFSDAVNVEILYRACRDPEDVTKPVFPGPKALRQALTTEECGTLVAYYLTVEMELGPRILEMTDEQAEAWIDRLVEGGTSSPFSLLGSDLQQLLVLHMAYALRPGKSKTGTGSAGSPPDSESTPPSKSGSSLESGSE
jgi:hypothetical protein